MPEESRQDDYPSNARDVMWRERKIAIVIWLAVGLLVWGYGEFVGRFPDPPFAVQVEQAE